MAASTPTLAIPEAVALALMERYFTYSQKPPASGEEVLDAYAKCLRTVRLAPSR